MIGIIATSVGKPTYVAETENYTSVQEHSPPCTNVYQSADSFFISIPDLTVEYLEIVPNSKRCLETYRDVRYSRHVRRCNSSLDLSKNGYAKRHSTLGEKPISWY
jgi:hypothetical protein